MNQPVAILFRHTPPAPGGQGIAMLIYLEMLDEPEDRDKFHQIYDTYKHFLFQVASRILHNQQDTEDVLHEAFVTILANIDRISELDSPQTRAYLVSIVENRAIDLYRKKQRHPTSEFTEELGCLSAEAYDPDDRLANCFLKLPAQQREYLLLRYDKGFSNREIAAMLHLSDAATRKLAQRAKKKLEILCKKEGLL